MRVRIAVELFRVDVVIPREDLGGLNQMRHVLGVLGVAAAGVLLAVSAAINWRFGYSLGNNELDGQIYGAASAAADCFKALVPFFFFAALKNRVWSQAAASAVIWVVVTAYSLTSALGHSAAIRFEKAGERMTQTQVYNDLRAELKRAEDQMSWIPQHRPAMAIASDLAGVKNAREWGWTRGCTETNLKGALATFCQKVHGLGSELASAQQAELLSKQISDLRVKIEKHGTTAVNSLADPQATVLAKLVAWVGLPLKVDDVQTALAVFVAVLLEVGSGFGMYVSFSQWRLYDKAAPKVQTAVASARSSVVATPVMTAPPVVATAPTPSVLIAQKPAEIANDNKSAPSVARLVAPDDDVERYRKERIEHADGSSLTATELYMDYCAWCEEQQKEPLALPTFGRELGELGVPKAKIAGRVRYIGIALKGAPPIEEERRTPLAATAAA